MKPPIGTATAWFADYRRIHTLDIEALQPVRFAESRSGVRQQAGSQPAEPGYGIAQTFEQCRVRETRDSGEMGYRHSLTQ